MVDKLNDPRDIKRQSNTEFIRRTLESRTDTPNVSTHTNNLFITLYPANGIVPSNTVPLVTSI